MTASYEDISLTLDRHVARIQVERPGKLNAYRNETADEMLDALRRAEDNEDIRVAITSGAGRAFGAGYDLSSIRPDTRPDLDVVLERHFNPLIRQMRRSRLPIISQVGGPCAGAAVGVALAGDIVIAARSAYFYEPFVGIALVPDAGNTLFLPRAAGRFRSAPMMLLGDRLSAAEALSWGLVWRVFEDEELPGEADRIASALAERSPAAVAATKRLVAAASDFQIDAHLDLERNLQGVAGRSEETKEAVAKFFASRQAGRAKDSA
jgi:2-(1,2-epoxy-1,2-dihydrophenyl)acetyl-CoA isomerase